MARLRVRRRGYVTKQGRRVAPAIFYIEDRGAPGRGKRLFEVEKGKLSRFGYSTSLPVVKRRFALNRAVREYGPLSVFRMLNAQVVLRKREQKSTARIFEADRNWIKKVYMGDKL